jgi:SET domain-containing protein
MMLIKNRVGLSAIHGIGLFSVEPIARGTQIWRFLPGFDHEFSVAEYEALPDLARAHTRWFCFVSSETGNVILSGDHACAINHAPDPNTGSESGTRGPVTTVALRDIAAGEEITCNYFHYDADACWKLGLVPSDSPLGAKGGN